MIAPSDENRPITAKAKNPTTEAAPNAARWPGRSAKRTGLVPVMLLRVTVSGVSRTSAPAMAMTTANAT